MSFHLSTPTRRAVAAGVLAGVLAFTGCDDGPTGPQTAAPDITTATLPTATVAEPYSEGITVTGGNGEYFWDLVSGSLPPGLELSADDLTATDVLITGIPEDDGTYTFRLSVRDGLGRADTARLTLTVRPEPQPLTVATLRLPPTLAGFPFEVHLEALGGDGDSYEWSVVEGSLPPGLELTGSGAFQGAPASPDTATFTVEVRSAGFTARRTFTLPVIPDRPDRYTITAFPVVDVPPALQANVDEAIRRWEAAIVGDLESGTIPGDTAFFDSDDSCGGFGKLVNGASLDDVIILVNIDSIDGRGGEEGNVLGQASPCGIRGDLTPFVGFLTLDEYDLLGITNQELVTGLIQHEMGHILGFGTLWRADLFDLVEGTNDTIANDPRYTGEAAVAEYRGVVGSATSIPVENTGGQGTENSHWRESVFGNELMTGYANQNMFLSKMTIASFEDLGYQVDRSAADAAPLLGLLDGAWFDEAGATLGYDIAGEEPIIVLHPDGRRTVLRPESRIP